VVRAALREAAEAAGFDSARLGDLLTSAHESGMNGLMHAGGADISVYRSGDRVQVWVEDRGKGIELDRLPISTLKQGFSTAGTAGQGWFFVLTLVDAAYLLTGGTGTTVVLEMDREPPQEMLPFSVGVGGDVHARPSS